MAVLTVSIKAEPGDDPAILQRFTKQLTDSNKTAMLRALKAIARLCDSKCTSRNDAKKEYTRWLQFVANADALRQLQGLEPIPANPR